MDINWKADHLHYTYEKITMVVYMLTVAPGNIRQRFMEVSTNLLIIRKDTLPESLQEDWNWIMRELTKYGPVKDHNGNILVNSIIHTMKRRQNRTVVRIAERLVYIKTMLSGILEEEAKDHHKTW